MKWLSDFIPHDDLGNYCTANVTRMVALHQIKVETMIGSKPNYAITNTK